MNIIEQIKAEIKRRIDILEGVSTEQAKKSNEEMFCYYHGKAIALEELLSFLDTLEEKSEIPTNLDLDEEIDKCLWARPIIERKDGKVMGGTVVGIGRSDG